MDARTGLPVVGMVGAGQLARMTQQAAIALGQSVRILADSVDDGAALVAAEVMVGDYRSLPDLLAFAQACDVITFDHEHVPAAHIRALKAAGHIVHPGADALQFAQDKIAMRQRMDELGIAGPRWVELPDEGAGDALTSFAADAGWPVVLKAATGGYDGKGVWLVGSRAEADAVFASIAGPRAGGSSGDGPRASGSRAGGSLGGQRLLAEQAVPIARELAAVVARSPFGQGASWPIVQTVQEGGICVEVLAPAPELDADTAERVESLALKVAGELGVVGVLAVELFETTDGRILVNELAMRPHNSGHWGIEGSLTSQFEQHLRAILDYPLGSTAMTAPVVVMANLLAGSADVTPKGIDERVHHMMARWPDVKIHLYGKGFRPGRKVGHVTALGSDLAEVRTKARAAAEYLAHGDPH